MRRVLGVDPGSRLTGYGVIEGEGDLVRAVAYGTIALDDSLPVSHRLFHLYHSLADIIEASSPSEMAVERVFVSRNADSALKLGHARGVILLAAREAGLEVFEYSPAMVKKAVAGRGRAEKYQVSALVRLLLGVNEDLGEDTTDALAVALTHLFVTKAPFVLGYSKEGPTRL